MVSKSIAQIKLEMEVGTFESYIISHSNECIIVQPFSNDILDVIITGTESVDDEENKIFISDNLLIALIDRDIFISDIDRNEYLKNEFDYKII